MPFSSCRVLNSTMFESWAIVGPYPSWWLFNSLLLILQVLHVIWSYLIARIALKAMLRGKVSVHEVTRLRQRANQTPPSAPANSRSAARFPQVWPF